MENQEANRQIDTLFASWASSLYRYAYRLTRSHTAAEDLVQEAFFCLYRQFRQGASIANPRGWTLNVVRNLASKLHRDSSRHPEELRPLDAFDRIEGSVGDAGEMVSETDDLMTLLSELTSREEEVLLLRLQAIKYKDIAAQLGISHKSVATLLARALKKLQIAAKNRLNGLAKPVGRKPDVSRTLQ